MSESACWLDRVAHDLRGPLMPLQTASYLLRSGQLDAARQGELFDVIERQTRQLTRMIDELGDWIRASQRRLIGRREPCDIALLLEYATAAAPSLPPAIDDCGGGAIVDGDAQRLTQLLRILLGFAAQAEDGGSATVHIACTDGRLRIDLRTHRTVDAEAAATLLEAPQAAPFDGGLGLQLLLARAIAEAHEGSLTALAVDGNLLLRCELPIAPET